MFIEPLLFIALLLIISLSFYRQRRSDIEILQIDESQTDEQLGDILQELRPTIIRGCMPPKGLTQDSLTKIHRLAKFSVGGQPLEHILMNPAIMKEANGAPVLSSERREILAQELSLQVWANHMWLPKLSQTTLVGWATGSIRAEVLLGGIGMFRTSAIYTCIIPTEGKYTLSIISKDSESFLPSKWEYRYPGTLTTNDTPLISDLKFMDIVLRPGTTACLPPHTIISMESVGDTFSAAAIIEYHEPISLIVKSIS